MAKKTLKLSLAALLLLGSFSAVKNVSAESDTTGSTTSSPQWKADASLVVPSWFNEQQVQNGIMRTEINKDGYNFVHKNGQPLSKDEVSSFVEGTFDILPDENNQKANLVAVGYYTVNGQIQTDFYFSNIENTPIKDIKKQAVEVADKEYKNTKAFTTKNLLAQEPADTFPVDAATAAAAQSYIDTYHWSIYSDQEKYSDGTYVVAGLLDSTVEYSKAGTAVMNGSTVSVWDVKASNQTKPVNGYQTRQIASRHTVEAYVPDQKLLSYGPSTTTAGSNFTVSLSGINPTIPALSWNFSRQSVDVKDSSSLSAGYGKWTFDFPLGTAVAKGSFLMQPGIRVSNATGMVKFQHSHSGYYYKDLSAQGNGVSGLVTRELPDR